MRDSSSLRVFKGWKASLRFDRSGQVDFVESVQADSCAMATAFEEEDYEEDAESDYKGFMYFY